MKPRVIWKDGARVRVRGDRGEVVCTEADGSVRVRLDTGRRVRVDASVLEPERGPRTPPAPTARIAIGRACDPSASDGTLLVEVGELRAAPKTKTHRDPAFLHHLRGRPCCSCGSHPPSVAAHFGPDRGVGIKCSDYHACSLCWGCHELWHQHGTLPGLTREHSMLVQWRDAALALVTFLVKADCELWRDVAVFLESKVAG